uniref:[histone H3]-lysine(4) N-trimethyltransferase n=1 Tax=Papio anubis TaxID=9555 RepID=A0A8I5NP52_PAPAN
MLEGKKTRLSSAQAPWARAARGALRLPCGPTHAAPAIPPDSICACSCPIAPAPPLGRTWARRAQARGSRQPVRRQRLDAGSRLRCRSCGRMEPLKVEKFATANRGNGLRAVTALRPGELLFRSDPLAYTVCKGSRGVVCDRCLLGKEKLMRCSQCRVAKYCSAKCQKKAWPDHKRECKCLKSCKPRYPPDSVRLLGRVVFKLMDGTPSESEKLYSFYDLESNINKLTEDKKEGLRQLVMTFQHFMREEIQDASQLPPAFDLFEAFAKKKKKKILNLYGILRDSK